MEGLTSLCVRCKSISTMLIYNLSKFSKLSCEYEVLYSRNLEKFKCQCQLWNSHGIPCSYIFCVNEARTNFGITR